MAGLVLVSWVLVFGSVSGIIIAGAALALDHTTCGPSPRWVVPALCGSIITGSLGSIAAQVTV
ncbi:hypothetical protein CH263_20325 [Rhodococcus sp. 06-1059B-a]|nr:hypothetical protein [Rhodococcus sp. 06-1059B-a]OZD60839.1 hypothetical protein CH263_20325 [Rhodococcus sp. 06-1059B-a]